VNIPAPLERTPPSARLALAFRTAVRAGHKGTVRAGLTTLDDRLGSREVVGFTIERSDKGGAIDAADGEVLAEAAALALSLRRPLVGVLHSTGVDVTAGMAALHGWGRAARAMADCSGIVPIILVVDGAAVSGAALLLGLADMVVMTSSSYAFVSGPSMVADFTGIVVDNDTLGGAATHARQSGLPSVVVDDVLSGLDVVAQLLGYLPDHADVVTQRVATDDPTERDVPELNDIIPASSTGSYDVRKVAASICDEDSVFEVRARWAPNLVTAFATVGGQAVGVVANQPLSLAGTLDIPAAQKGAWFVALCDSFNLPIVTLVDTPGYFPGKDLEWRGMIRHGAQMAYAYAEATVPRVCVVLRKAYGGAFIVMDCKTMGNDLCLAWPVAELAVMGAKGAVQILYRRESEADRLVRELDYAQAYLNPYVAAERGYVDAVVEPSQTRRLVARSLDFLATKREMLAPKRHGNSPL
jgi:acetyl-CoA carboxylase carboxyltransferase component